MNAKEYLKQIVWQDKKINAMIDRAERFRDLATRCTPAYSETGGISGGGTDRAEYITKIVDLEKEINARIDGFVDLVREAEALIDSLPDPRHREILRWRYLSGWDWKKIASATGYSLDWVFHLHGVALMEFDKCRNGQTRQ